MTANLKKQIGICIFIVDIVAILILVYLTFQNKIEGYVAYKKGIDYVVQYSDGIENNSSEKLREGLRLIDRNVKESFLRHNGHILVLNQEDFIEQIQIDIAKGLPNKQKTSYEDIAGYCGIIKRENLIKKVDISYLVTLNANYIELSVPHEFGHYIDYVANEKDIKGVVFEPISNSDEFQAIWREEKDNSGLGDYFTNNSEEYFAESYHALKVCPDTYYERCPKTCEFISKIVATI